MSAGTSRHGGVSARRRIGAGALEQHLRAGCRRRRVPRRLHVAGLDRLPAQARGVSRQLDGAHGQRVRRPQVDGHGEPGQPRLHGEDGALHAGEATEFRAGERLDVIERRLQARELGERRLRGLRVPLERTRLHRPLVSHEAQPLCRVQSFFEDDLATPRSVRLLLATVYGIIKQSEGYIHCASEPLAGTTFTILLPLAPGEVPGAAPAPRTPRSLGGSESVLVVEDEEAIRGLVSTVLGRHGYRVRTARNGEEALAEAAAEADRLHLLLTDVVMPRMSGPELGRRVREICPHARVLYMSGFTDHPAMREDTEVEGEQLIRKPFTAEVLLERVRAALDAGPAGS